MNSVNLTGSIDLILRFDSNKTLPEYKEFPDGVFTAERQIPWLNVR